MADKVLITKSKLDTLAESVSAKSGQGVPLTVDEMNEAVLSIAPKLQAKSVGPSIFTQKVEPDSGYDGLSSVDVGAMKLTSIAVTPQEYEQTIDAADGGYDGLRSVTVNSIPGDYVVPEGTRTITENGTGIDVASYASVDVNVPTGGTMVIRDSTDAHGGTVREITAGSVVTGTKTITANGTYDVAEYADALVDVPSAEPALQAKTATPTESQQTVMPDSDYDGLSSVTVGAVSSTYVGSGITRRSSSDLTASGATVTVPGGYYSSSASKAVSSGSATAPSSISGTSATVSTGTNTLTLSKTVSVTPSVTAGYVSSGTAGNSNVSLTASVSTRSSSDLTASGATVTVPAGYYASQASKAVSSGTAGTPTATKGSVNNHTVSITPSVSNTAGYITGGTKTGTAVTVSASELVSGTLSITSSGTKDVTNYASASVAAGGATASAAKGTVSNHSVTVTPSVTRTAGYVTAGSANGAAVTVSASELVSGSQTITENGTVDVTNLASVDVSVPAPEPLLQEKTVTPTNEQQIITPDGPEKTVLIAAGTTKSTTNHTYISPNTAVSFPVRKPVMINGKFKITNTSTGAVDNVVLDGIYFMNSANSMAANASTPCPLTHDGAIVDNAYMYTSLVFRINFNASISATVEFTEDVTFTEIADYTEVTSGELTSRSASPQSLALPGLTVGKKYSVVGILYDTYHGDYYNDVNEDFVWDGSGWSHTIVDSSGVGTCVMTISDGSAVTMQSSGSWTSMNYLLTVYEKEELDVYDGLSKVTVEPASGGATLLYSGTLGTISTTSTTEETVTTINLGATAWDYTKILYISIWRTTGRYSEPQKPPTSNMGFLGTETFYLGAGQVYQYGQDPKTSSPLGCYQIVRYANGYAVIPTSAGYGVYPSNLTNEGVLTISSRYSSSYSSTIGGSYDIAVYQIEYPHGDPWFGRFL